MMASLQSVVKLQGSLIRTIKPNMNYSLLLKQSRNHFTDISNATYGGRHTVTLIPAHGIGPSLISGIRDVFGSCGVPVDFEEANLSGNTPEDLTTSFEEVLTSIKRNGRALKGSWITEYGRTIGGKSFNVALRHELGLFANVVNCRSYPTIKTRHSDVDLVIIRENSEGEYSNLEHENVPGVIEMLKVVTEESSNRIAKFAFEHARRHDRKKVTAIHKANIMKMSDGLFLNCCREMSKRYPDIEFNDMIIDNCAMQMVSRPEQFDVMVMPNLYGNVVTSIAAALVGGPGLPSGENHGNNLHVFESGTRNSGKDIADKNVANPMSMLFAATAMLRHLGLNRHAHLVDVSIFKIVTSGRARTLDVGGNTSTTEFFDILIGEIESTRCKRKAHSN